MFFREINNTELFKTCAAVENNETGKKAIEKIQSFQSNFPLLPN